MQSHVKIFLEKIAIKVNIKAGNMLFLQKNYELKDRYIK